MVIVPAGIFRMGDIKGSAYERPVHTVNFAQAFAMGRYTVTFDEYDYYAKSAGISLPDDQGWGRERRPVMNVSWQEAVAYAQWLAEQTGKLYCLPSEADWEYAARAGTGTAYWWGDAIGSNRANCSGSGSEWSGKQTAPVGSFKPNPWGLHDTVGNVWEWVQDPFGMATIKARSPMAQCGSKGEANRGCCVAALGSTIETSPVLRPASASIQATVTAVSVFVWLVCFPMLFDLCFRSSPSSCLGMPS
jgi:formylglycine-generating enzyme required for sulfatase activity